MLFHLTVASCSYFVVIVDAVFNLAPCTVFVAAGFCCCSSAVLLLLWKLVVLFAAAVIFAAVAAAAVAVAVAFLAGLC